MISRRTLCAALTAAPVLTSAPSLAYADDSNVQLMTSELTRSDDSSGLNLAVHWEFDLLEDLAESLNRGIALYFVYEFRLQRSRWYWTDKDVATAEFVQRITFSPLSRQYRLSRDGLTLSYETLDQALQLIKHIRGWSVADRNAVSNLENFEAETRMHLDVSRLPKPMQVSIGGNSDWSMDSGWCPVRLKPELLAR